MYALVIAIINGFVVAVICNAQGVTTLWSVLCGIMAVITTQIILALLIRKTIGIINNELQLVMQEGQQKVNRKVHQFQLKPRGNLKTMQKIIEKEQAQSLREALIVVAKMEKYANWNLLLGRQINTLRMQLHYQLKEFDKVDELIPKALFMDANAVAMKIARMYHNDQDEKLAKFFKSKIKKFKGDEAVLLYALYSWIMVKRGKIDEAIKILVEGKDSTDNEVLKQNWDSLVNNKIKRFSNAALGDPWYSLQLEEPKVQKQQKRVKNIYR